MLFPTMLVKKPNSTYLVPLLACDAAPLWNFNGNTQFHENGAYAGVAEESCNDIKVSSSKGAYSGAISERLIYIQSGYVRKTDWEKCQ